MYATTDASTTSIAIGPLTNGSHTVIIKATDSSSNSIIKTCQFTTNSNLSNVSVNQQYSAGTTNALIDDTATSGVVLDGINTTGDVTISIGQYSSTPSADKFSGVSAFGKSFEITASDVSKISFPLMVKIYYTQSDLTNAGITEDKLDGIYFYNSVSGKYERYSDSGVNTVDVMVGLTQFAGYVFANVDHLTPLTAAFDTIAPVNSTSVTVSAGDGKVMLSWDKVSDAQKYTIRYRKSISVDSSSTYTYIDADGSLSNQEISGLTNGVEYEFGVAAKDRVGNFSPYLVVVATPKAITTSLTASVTTAIQLAAPTNETTVSQPFENKSQIVQSVEPKTADTATDEGEIKGDETQTTGSRAAVTLAILLLALAAGVGGYYGYEWWVEKKLSDGPHYIPKEEKAVKPKTNGRKKPTPKNNRRNGRW